MTDSPPKKKQRKAGAWREVKYDDDNDLLLRFKTEIDLNLRSWTIPEYARILRRFSDWLYEQQKESVSRRLYSDDLMEDAKQFGALSRTSALPAVRSLREWHREQTGSSAVIDAPQGSPERGPAQSQLELLSPAFGGGRPVGEYGYAVGLGWLHGRQAAPFNLIAEMKKNGDLPTPFRSANVYIHSQPYSASLEPGIGLAALSSPGSGGDVILTPQIGRDPRGAAAGRIEPFRFSAAGACSSASAGESSFAYSASAARNGLMDFAPSVGPHWDHSRWDNEGQQLPDHLMRELYSWGQLPTPHQARTEFCIHGELYTAELRDGEWDPNRILGSQQGRVVYLIHHSDRAGTDPRHARSSPS